MKEGRKKNVFSKISAHLSLHSAAESPVTFNYSGQYLCVHEWLIGFEDQSQASIKDAS
jgi:hypothetical protein